MASFKAADKYGRYIEYGFAKFTGYYIHIWNENEFHKEIPSIVENQHTGLTGKGFCEMLDDLGAELPSKHRERALLGEPFDDEEVSF